MSLRQGWRALAAKWERYKAASGAEKLRWARRLKPHQGKREIARRLRQIAAGHHAVWNFSRPNHNVGGKPFPLWRLVAQQRDWRRQSVVA